jgi:DNA polymerase III delta prime subunit
MNRLGPHIRRVEEGLDPLLQEGRLPHAILVSGPPGVGKRSLIRRLARGILCSTLSCSGGCGSCGACRRVDLAEHPDLHLLERPAGKTKIPVQDVRDLLESLSRSSLEGRGRVALLAGVEDLGTEGQNALLKTLEEPFLGTWLLLSTSRPEALLDTVRSRVYRLGLPPLSLDEMRSFLAEAGISSDELSQEDLLSVAAGSPGRALELSEGLGRASLEQARQLLQPGSTEQAWVRAVFEGLVSEEEGIRQAKKLKAKEVLVLSLQLARGQGLQEAHEAWHHVELMLEAQRDLDLGLAPAQVLQALHRRIWQHRIV